MMEAFAPDTGVDFSVGIGFSQYVRAISARTNPAAPNPRSAMWILAAITLCGAVLRFTRLNYQSLWNDELWSWRFTQYDSFMRMVHEALIPDFHPPGFQTVLYYVVHWFGDSEFVLRFPSAVAGTLAIPAIYLVARRLYGKREGLIAALFLATSWFPIVESQEARAYAMLLLFTLLATWFWLRLVPVEKQDQTDLTDLSDPTNLANLIGYFVCAAVCAYLHYFGLYCILLQAIATALLLVGDKRKLAIMGLTYAGVFALYLPWFFIFLRHSGSYPLLWPRPNPATLLNYYAFIFNRSYWILGLCAGLVAVWGVCGGVRWARKRNRSITITNTSTNIDGARNAPCSWSAASRLNSWHIPPGLFLLAWLIVPPVVIYVRSRVSTPIFTPRYLIFCAPPAYILLARAVSELGRNTALSFAAAGALATLFVAHLVFVKHYYISPWKEQFREAVAYVLSQDGGRKSLILGGATGPEHYNYYFTHQSGKAREIVFGYRAQDLPQVQKQIAERRPDFVWLMFFDKLPEKGFFEGLKQRMRLLSAKNFLGGGVALFDNRVREQN